VKRGKRRRDTTKRLNDNKTEINTEMKPYNIINIGCDKGKMPVRAIIMNIGVKKRWAANTKKVEPNRKVLI
jgi:hypothetical protein